MRIKGSICFVIYYGSLLFCQPDSRFRPFDWVLYKGSGSINSISEGFNYAYIGTEDGGVKRLNTFSLVFDEPITSAQGLQSNTATAVHFDTETGFLWVASSNHLQYSFSREGSWFPLTFESLGISRFDRIRKIGSSIGYIWLELKSSFVKIDHSNGNLIGVFSKPDEISIKWSSGPYEREKKMADILLNYSFNDGWILIGADLIDNLGRRSRITTGFIGKHGNIYVGNEYGTLFLTTKVMQTFDPIVPDIENFDISAIGQMNDILYLGSTDYINSKGLTQFNTWNNEIESFIFEETINMTPTPIFSINADENELWIGGDEILLFHDKKKNFWRTLGQERGLPSGEVLDILVDETHAWVASSRGLSRISRATKREDPAGFEYLFSEIPVYELENYGNDIWIGAWSGVYVYSKSSPQLKNSIEFGQKLFPELMLRITSMKKYDDAIYIACNAGIVKYSVNSSEWELIINAVQYQNKNIHSLEIKNNNVFLGTLDGLVKINKKTGSMKEYYFPFIGKVNEMVLLDNILWLGTSNGLIKFKWKTGI